MKGFHAFQPAVGADPLIVKGVKQTHFAVERKALQLRADVIQLAVNGFCRHEDIIFQSVPRLCFFLIRQDGVDRQGQNEHYNNGNFINQRQLAPHTLLL